MHTPAIQWSQSLAVYRPEPKTKRSHVAGARASFLPRDRKKAVPKFQGWFKKPKKPIVTPPRVYTALGLVNTAGLIGFLIVGPAVAPFIFGANAAVYLGSALLLNGQKPPVPEKKD